MFCASGHIENGEGQMFQAIYEKRPKTCLGKLLQKHF